MSLGMPRHVLSPKILHLYIGRSGPPSNTWFLKPSWILNPNSISIGLAIVERPYTLQWPPFLPQNCPFPLWSGSHLIHVSLGPSEFSTQTAHYIYIYIHFRGLLPLDGILPVAIDFTSKSCILLYWQHYCTALQQRASAKLRCSTRNEIMELSQRRYLYSAGQPSRWASAHILVLYDLEWPLTISNHLIFTVQCTMVHSAVLP